MTQSICGLKSKVQWVTIIVCKFTVDATLTKRIKTPIFFNVKLLTIDVA